MTKAKKITMYVKDLDRFDKFIHNLVEYYNTWYPKEKVFVTDIELL